MSDVCSSDLNSAMRYLDGADPFARQRIEASLPPIVPPRLALPAPTVAPVPTTTAEATITLTRFTPRVRGLTKAQRLIEQICLHPHQAPRLRSEEHTPELQSLMRNPYAVI